MPQSRFTFKTNAHPNPLHLPRHLGSPYGQAELYSTLPHPMSRDNKQLHARPKRDPWPGSCKLPTKGFRSCLSAQPQALGNWALGRKTLKVVPHNGIAPSLVPSPRQHSTSSLCMGHDRVRV